jgi:hypothetical protein
MVVRHASQSASVSRRHEDLGIVVTFGDRRDRETTNATTKIPTRRRPRMAVVFPGG